jgi:hypothetical protein
MGVNAGACHMRDRRWRRALPHPFHEESKTMKFDRRSTFLPLASLALCFPLASCGDDDDNGVGVTDTETTGTTADDTTGVAPTTMPTVTEPTTEPTTVTDTDTTGIETETETADDTTGDPGLEADVRFVHLSPDAPAVDIYLNPEGQAAVADLEFTDGTPFLMVEEGEYDVRVTAAGDDPRDAVISVDDFQVPAGRFTVAAFGELDNIDLMVVEEDDSRITPNSLRAFVGHAADGVGTVDVWAIGLEDDPVEVLSDLEYGEWERLDIPADTEFSIGLDVDADGAPDFVFDIPELLGGITISLFAVLDETSPFLIAYLPDGSAAGPIRPNDD